MKYSPGRPSAEGPSRRRASETADLRLKQPERVTDGFASLPSPLTRLCNSGAAPDVRLNSSFIKRKGLVHKPRLPAFGIAVFGNEHPKDIQVVQIWEISLLFRSPVQPITRSPDLKFSQPTIAHTGNSSCCHSLASTLGSSASCNTRCSRIRRLLGGLERSARSARAISLRARESSRRDL